MDKLFKKGMYEPDEDFPDDKSEFFYFVGQGTTVRKDDKKSEKMKLSIKDKQPDKDLGEALLTDGVLSSGAMPALGCGSEEGSKAVLEALHGEVTKKPVKKETKKKDEEDTETVEPKEAWERLRSIPCLFLALV